MNRNIEVGDVLGEVFSTYRDNAGVLLPVAFLLYLVVAVVNGLVGGSLLMLAIAFAVSITAGTLYQGMVVELVSDVQDGRRDSTAGDLLNSAVPFIGPLIGVGLFAGICIGVGLLLFLIPGLFLLTIWAVIAPVIVVERARVFESLGRSRDLVRGHAWQVFGVILVTFLIVAIASFAFMAIGNAIADGPALRIVFGVIAYTVTAPIGALVASVLYFRLRAMKGETSMGEAAPPPAPAV
ncbi:MAG TPA: hypothetical protein VFY48_08500 [Solirubrobacterales bacterium]|nr:hypothetical protein [Solirubrobacterales bacterium]